MVVTASWPPTSSGIVQSVSLRWDGCPRSATMMILLLMTTRWRLVNVFTQHIFKVFFMHQYLLKSVLFQGQINYLYWCLVKARRALGRRGCGGNGFALCWLGRQGCNSLAALSAPAALGLLRGRSVHSGVHACLPGYKFILVKAFKLPVLASTWKASNFVLLFFYTFLIFPSLPKSGLGVNLEECRPTWEIHESGLGPCVIFHQHQLYPTFFIHW